MNDLLFFCTNNTNKLENKNQIEEEKPKHKLLHTEQNSAIEFTYAFNESEFCVDSKWRKECWPSYLQFAIAWQTSKRFSWKQLVSMTFSFMLAPWNAKHAVLSFSVSRFRSHFPYASVSVITLALNYGDKMCIIFSLKLKCSSRTHITWIRYNISTYSTYF